MARRERAQRDRRLEKPAIEVLTATGEREATIAATEQGAGAALQAMITDESLTVFEAVQGAPALSVIGKRPSFAIQPQAHHSRGDSSWGVVVFRWFMTPKTQVHCRRVGACLPVVADVKHMSGWISGRVGQTSMVHTVIISAVISTVLRPQPS
jgi:hypothetical protein